MKNLQRYATRKFFSLKSAIAFKEKVNSGFAINKETETGLYSIRFKIDKSIPKSLTYHLNKR